MSPRVAVQLVAGRLDDEDCLPLLARAIDCIVNSANAQLLTPGVTGIAGAVRRLGGQQLVAECDATKAASGGELPVGSAVWTGAGSLRCLGIAHAVTLRYGPQGRRELATPSGVASAFGQALQLAEEAGCESLACYVMCARAGYSTVEPSSDAPAVMLSVMLSALEAIHERQLRRVLLFVPDPRLLLPAVLPPSRTVLWCAEQLLDASAHATSLQEKSGVLLVSAPHATLERCQQLLDENEPWVLVTGSVEHVRAASGVQLRVIYAPSSSWTPSQQVEAWCAGAHWLTSDLGALLGLLAATPLLRHPVLGHC